MDSTIDPLVKFNKGFDQLKTLKQLKTKNFKQLIRDALKEFIGLSSFFIMNFGLL